MLPIKPVSEFTSVLFRNKFAELFFSKFVKYSIPSGL